MNRLSYRIVFSTTRGQLVAVAECASSHSKSCGERAARKLQTREMQGLPSLMRAGLLCATALAAWLAVQPGALAQVIADTNAPANQRPTVLTNWMGGPLVNIQTPSAAGVSRNTYSRFDVGFTDTVILNNNRYSNPWLATGSARVILNEVNSSNPSNLGGQIMVEGYAPGNARADVVFANPSGINVNGVSFFGTGRVTLTTGTPVMNAGALTGFNVTKGTVDVASMGMGVNGAGSFADIISRSAVIGGVVRADQSINVVTGPQTVDYATGATTPLAGTGTQPALAIDTKALGGMYAGSISLLSTEAGVGVRNQGTLQANTGSGQLIVTADGRLENTGRMDAAYTSVATVVGNIDNSGNLLGRQLLLASAGGDFNHTGAGLAQNEASTSPLSDPWHTAYNIGSGMAQDTGSASQVFINAKRDVNVAAGARISSNASVSAADGALKKGQVVISSGRDVFLDNNSNLNANGAIQISSDGYVSGNRATVSSASDDITMLAKQNIGLFASNVTGNKVHLETGSPFQETVSNIAITGGQLNGAQQTSVIATGDLSIATGGYAGVGSSEGHVYLQAGKNLTVTHSSNASAAGHFTAKAGGALTLQAAQGVQGVLSGDTTAQSGQIVRITAGQDVTLSGASVSMTGTRINATNELAVEASTGDITLNALTNTGGTVADAVVLNAGADMSVSAYGGSIRAQGLAGTGANIHVLSNGATRLAHAAVSSGPVASTLDAKGKLVVGSVHETGAVDIVGASLKAGGAAQVSSEGAITFTAVTAGTGPVLPTVSGASVQIQGGSVTAPAAAFTASNGYVSVAATSGDLSMIGVPGSASRSTVSATKNVALHAEKNASLQGISASAGANLAVTSNTGVVANTSSTLTAKDMLSISSKGGQSHSSSQFTAGAMSVYNETGALTLTNSTLQTGVVTSAAMLSVSGQMSVESGEGIVVDAGTRFIAGTDLSIVAGTGNITITPDRNTPSAAGMVLTPVQLQAGRDITVGARNGVLTFAGVAGVAGNPTAKVVTLNSKRDLRLFGSAVQLQAPKISAVRDVNITSTGGNVLIDGVKSAFTAYVPKERVDALIGERTRYETLISQEQALLNANTVYVTLKKEVANLQIAFDDYMSNGMEGVALSQILPLLRSKGAQLATYEQNLTTFKSERDALVPMITTLSAKAKGAEHLGASIAGRNINVTSAAGLAVYGADVSGSGTVSLKSAGVLPIDSSAATTELQRPVGTLVAGLSDFYEYGAAGTSYHAFSLISRPSVISGAAGVTIQAAGDNPDARLIVNDSAIRSSAGTVSLQSLGDMRLEAGQEEFYSKTVNTYTRRSWLGLRKKTTTTTKTTQSVAASPVVLESQNITIKSGGSIDAYATEFLAPQGQVQITAANALNLHAVDEVNVSNFDAKTRSSFLGITYSKGTTTQSRTVSAQLPAKLVASMASTASGWNTVLQGTTIQTSLTGANIAAGVGPNARADAQVILDGIKKTVTESKTKESNYVVWQRQLGSGSTVETMTLPSFTGPTPPVFSAPGGLTVQVPEGELTAQIQTLSQQPGMAYLNELGQRKDVNWQPVKLAFDQWSYEQEGLTPAGAALLGAAVAWATGSMGSELLGEALGTQLTGASALMADAAFTSLAAQASITLVNNKGNIGKTLSDLAKSDIVKATIAAALTAGVLEKINALDSIKGLNLGDPAATKLAHNLINAGGRALTNTAISGGNLEEALKQALVGGLVDTAHGAVASQIKTAGFDYLSHKLAHALAGCVAGAAAGGECRDGAIGAAVGEVVAEMFKGQRPDLSSASDADINAYREKVVAYSKLVAGAVSAYAGGDAQTAITTAETAVRNNYLNHYRKDGMLSLSEVEQYNQASAGCQAGDVAACGRRDILVATSLSRDRALSTACGDGAAANPVTCNQLVREARSFGNVVNGNYGGFVWANSPYRGFALNTNTVSAPGRPANFQDALARSTASGLALVVNGPEDLIVGAVVAYGGRAAVVAMEGAQKVLLLPNNLVIKVDSIDWTKQAFMPSLPAGAVSGVNLQTGEIVARLFGGQVVGYGNKVELAPVLRSADNSTVWVTDITVQGQRGEALLGRQDRGIGLHNSEPVIDVWDPINGLAVSQKTLNWNAPSYAGSASAVEYQLKTYVDQLVAYQGTGDKTLMGLSERITVPQINAKSLEVVLPSTGGSQAHIDAVNRIIDYAKLNGIDAKIYRAN